MQEPEKSSIEALTQILNFLSDQHGLQLYSLVMKLAKIYLLLDNTQTRSPSLKK